MRAATRNCASETVRAPAMIAASPTPGKMNALLACPIWRVVPSTTTGSNGLPVATSARPSVHARTWAGVASQREVGFESGRMIGCGHVSAIARRIGSVKVLGVAVVPIRIAGRTAWTTLSRSAPAASPRLASSAALSANSRLSSSSPGRSSPSRPFESRRISDRRISSSPAPASTRAARTSRAMPVAAAPAPKNTKRRPRSGSPTCRRPARIPARTTDAVPWMSSLNDGSTSR